MSTVAVMMCKDEADIIRYTVLHTLGEVDRMLIADNMSTDGTRDILSDLAQQYPNELTVIDDNDKAYYQSKKMTALAASVAGDNEPWIVPVDADELWYWKGDRIADELARLDVYNVVRAPLYNHFCSALDEPDDNPYRRIVYRQPEPGALRKVAFRWNSNAVIAQGNHDVWLGLPNVDLLAGLELRHFPYRNVDQFVRKALNGAAAYAETNLPAHEGAHWREYAALYDRFGESALRDVYEQWFYFPAPVTAGMVLDPAPYQRWAQ
jgi:glycosyltransferase involved in cell wall biosynthesis